ncbi:MAG TPA: type II toxin-antitoxin system prevent-host-death family antitoxin [Lichenihabitans sp.]|nr:type II toxin-antitoxin system prevent-host-death family antitoxin [Lichenihabitans sp.]
MSVDDAKLDLPRLIADAIDGKDVFIVKERGEAVKLTPVDIKPARRPGALKGQIALTPEFFEPLSANELAAWIGDASDKP